LVIENFFGSGQVGGFRAFEDLAPHKWRRGCLTFKKARVKDRPLFGTRVSRNG